MYTRIRQIIRVVTEQTAPVRGAWAREVMRFVEWVGPPLRLEAPLDLTPPPPDRRPFSLGL